MRQMAEDQQRGFILGLLRKFGLHPLEGTVLPPKPVPVAEVLKGELQPAGEPPDGQEIDTTN